MNLDDPLQNLVKPPKVKFANYLANFSQYLSSFCSFKNTMVSFDKCQISFTLLKHLRTLKDPKTCIVYTHSHGSSGEEGLELVQACQATGVSLCYYDSRGCGSSGDAYNTFGKDENIDLLYICFYLIVIYNFDEFILWGRSIGSCAVLQLISNLQNVKLGRSKRLDSHEYRRAEVGEPGLQRKDSQLTEANFDQHFLDNHFTKFLETNSFINEVPRHFRVIGMVLDSPPKSMMAAVENFVKVKFINFKLFIKMASLYTENWIKKHTGVDITIQQNFQLVRSINVNTIFLISPKDEMMPYEDSMELIKSFSVKCEQRCYFDVFRMNKGHKERRDTSVYVNTIEVLLQRKMGKANERYAFELAYCKNPINGIEPARNSISNNSVEPRFSRKEPQATINIYQLNGPSSKESSHMANMLNEKFERKITNAKRWSALRSQQDFNKNFQQISTGDVIENPSQRFGSEIASQKRNGHTPSNANPMFSSMTNSQMMQALIHRSSINNGSTKKVNASPRKHQIFAEQEKTSPLNDLRLSGLSLKKIGIPYEGMTQSRHELTPIEKNGVVGEWEAAEHTPRTPPEVRSFNSSHQVIPNLGVHVPETSNSKNMVIKSEFDPPNNGVGRQAPPITSEWSKKDSMPTNKSQPNPHHYFSTRQLPNFIEQPIPPTNGFNGHSTLPSKGQPFHQTPQQAGPGRFTSQVHQSLTNIPRTTNGYSTPVPQSHNNHFPSSNGNVHKSDFTQTTLEKNRLGHITTSNFFSEKKPHIVPPQYPQHQQWRPPNSGTGGHGQVRELHNPRTTDVLGLKEKILTSHLNNERFSGHYGQPVRPARVLLAKPEYRR
jgi:hypothetical protein